MNNLYLKLGEFDWMATRLTSRKYYPPSRRERVEQRIDAPLPADGGISRFTPEMIAIPGTEGLGVEIGKFGSQRTLLIRVAIVHPFTTEVMSFAKRSLARWNDTFNTWDIPILSQTKGNALVEAWNWIEEAFFEMPWNAETVELHWRYSVSDKSLEALRKRIESVNNLWNSSMPYTPTQIDLVYPRIDRSQLESDALKAFQELRPSFKWVPRSERSMHGLCVNYLRHKQSSYHLLLQTQKPYINAFADVNRAIAEAYPWLKQEADRQIAVKQKHYAQT